MIDQLYIALKRAAFDRQGFEIAGSTFSAAEAKQLTDSMAQLMGESVALQVMVDQEIIDLFDSSNITLAELARVSGRSVAQLKALLMGGK